MSTRVKICGITHLADAEPALECGAWAVGLVFHPSSPRRCDVETAAAIGTALKRRADVVGVFVNVPLDEIVATADRAGLTMIQLHGDEGPAFCAEARRRTGLKLMKAVRVRDAASIKALSAYATDYHMLDAYVPGTAGGTGERFDWQLAAGHPPKPPLVLSGGLRPDNVAEAISVVDPFAVDVSSGVESEPGRKDHRRLHDFFRAVRAAEPAPV